MDDSQYRDWMLQVGWKAYQSGKETHFEMQLKDRTLRVPGTYTQLSDELFFDDHAKLWVADYAAAKHALFPDIKLDHCYVASRPNASTSTKGTGSAAFFEDVTKTLIAWAEGVNVQAEIQSAADAVERLGHFSFDHVAALAFTGNTTQLQTWRDKVSSGVPTGLSPMITVEVLDQALGIARKNRASPGPASREPRSEPDKQP